MSIKTVNRATGRQPTCASAASGGQTEIYVNIQEQGGRAREGIMPCAESCHEATRLRAVKQYANE